MLYVQLLIFLLCRLKKSDVIHPIKTDICNAVFIPFPKDRTFMPYKKIMLIEILYA